MGKNDSEEHWIGFLGSLNEVQARQLAGLKVREFCWGGISKVGRLTGMDYKTIKKGCLKLKTEFFLVKPKNFVRNVLDEKNVLIKIIKS